MESATRPSGIPLLGKLSWGSHLCQFYRTPDDLLELLVPYFKAGLDGNEACLWITSIHLSCASAEAALRAVVDDYDERVARGQIRIRSSRDWYLSDGRFDPQRMGMLWSEELTTALARGYAGLRVSGDASWVGHEQWNEFESYEARIDGELKDSKLIGLCTYPIASCGARETMAAMQSHRFTLMRRDGAWQVIEKRCSGEEAAPAQVT